MYMSRRLAASSFLVAALAVGCGGTGENADTGDAAANDMATSEMSGDDANAAESTAEAKRAAAEEAIDAGNAGEWSFGNDMGEATVVSVTDLNESPSEYAGKRVRIEGQVSSVCKNMGCWVEVTGSEGGKIMASSDAHDVFVPRNSEGKHIVVEGMFKETPADGEGEATYSLDLGAAEVTSSGTS